MRDVAKSERDGKDCHGTSKNANDRDKIVKVVKRAQEWALTRLLESDLELLESADIQSPRPILCPFPLN